VAYKSITTIAASEIGLRETLAAAIGFAQTQDAHLDVCCLGVDNTQAAGFYAGAPAVIYQEALDRARADAEALEARARELLRSADIRWGTDSAVVTLGGVASYVGLRARFSDLVIAARPYGAERGINEEAIIEAALFDGQAPVLVLPDPAPPLARFDRIVLAWNQSNESLRAARRALPLLKEAALVNIAVIDPPGHGPEHEAPGALLSRMLARHGVETEISALPRGGGRVADILMRQMDDQNADLLVMGAYSHSRLREAILGGATRDMLENLRKPVFTAH